MTNKRLTRRRFLVTNVGALMAGAFLRSSLSGQQPTNDPGAAYRSGRRSLFQLSPPPGKPLPTKTTDTGIRVSGDRAERMLTYIADAPALKRGDLVLCAEYGRIEIMDSDDDQIRLQIRLETNEAKAIEDTRIRAHLTWIHGTMRVVSSCNVTARTNEGNIRLSFSPEAETGMDITGRSDEGKVVLIGIAEDTTKRPTSKSGSEAHTRSEEFESKRMQV